MKTSQNKDGILLAVVEDDPSILDALELVLQDQGWDTRTFESGEEFLADLECGRKYDCLLLDPHLTGVTGADVAGAVAGNGLPILVITARPDSPLTKAIMTLGVRGVITKPVGASDLVETIAGLLAVDGPEPDPPSSMAGGLRAHQE